LTEPRHGPFLAFDYGSRSIGMAAGSPASGMASPLAAIRMLRSGPDWPAIDAAVAEWQPHAFIVGVALDGRGGDTPLSRRARKFGRRLGQRYQRRVHWVDETLSTEAARQALHHSARTGPLRKADIDNTAAALILESFLDSRR